MRSDVWAGDNAASTVTTLRATSTAVAPQCQRPAKRAASSNTNTNNKEIIDIYMFLDPFPIKKLIFQLKMGFGGFHWVDMVPGINMGVVKAQVD